MNTFICRRLRLCTYLVDAGFTPYRIEPDKRNPKYSVFLFEKTPALDIAVFRYFSTDCYTARMKNHRKESDNEHTKEESESI